jgi:hypothetical protein
MVEYFKKEMQENSALENTFSLNYKNYCDNLTSEMQVIRQDLADLSIFHPKIKYQK